MSLRTILVTAALLAASSARAQEQAQPPPPLPAPTQPAATTPPVPPVPPVQIESVHRIDATQVTVGADAADAQPPTAVPAASSSLLLAPATACPPGMLPRLENGQVVLGLDQQPICQTHHAFIKGELTNLGATKLLTKDSRFGIGLGYARLDQSSYLTVNPELDLRFGDNFAFGVGLPLNVRAYANGFVDGGGIKFRPHDYDNASDYARILRFLTYGKKEDPLYLNVSQLFAATIGHGAIVRRYSGNIDQNITRVGAELDAVGRYGGLESFVGDVVKPSHFLSGLAFVKPLGFLDGPLGETLGQTSIGLSTAMDLHAPYTLSRIPGGYPDVGSDGEPIVGVDRRAQIVGVDLETRIVKTAGADLKPFIDYSRLLGIQDPAGRDISGGGGLTLGMLGRFNVGEVRVHAFRAIVEARYFDGNYLPGYFDTFYEVQKYQFVTGKASPAYEPKLATILSRDPAQKRAGFYAEFGYQYNQGLGLMIAYENSYQVAGPDTVCTSSTAFCNDPNVGNQNFTFHIEYPAYSWVQFFASFYHRSYGGSPIDTSRPLGDNTLIYSGIRIHLLPILFLNARVYRSWQADPVLGEERNVWGGEADLEFGYEFNRK